MASRDNQLNRPSSMNVSATTVAGLFHDDEAAEEALEGLQEAGFSQDEIGIATSRQSDGGNEPSPHESFWDRIGGLFGKHQHPESSTQVEESLKSSGIPEQQSQYFNAALDEGDILINVRASGERADTATRILREAGADVANDTARVGSRRDAPNTQGEQRIELISEVLRVHKDRVQRGEVRLRKEVVTENQNIEVPVTREELVVERVAVENREAGATEVGAGETEIRVPLSEERLRVEKKPVVTEEVRVGKRQVQDTKRVADTVRHEELRSEQEGDVRADEVSKMTDKKRRSA